MHSINETRGLRNFQAIPQLAEDLFSKNYLLKKRAREELVEIGDPSLDVLVKLAHSKDEAVRWEAMITIVKIGSQHTLDVLLYALEDSEFSIRWLAAEGLISLGKYSIVPLLQKLLENSESMLLRRGAYHVLKELRNKEIFKDDYAIVEILSNEFDHSSISAQVLKTINSSKLT